MNINQSYKETKSEWIREIPIEWEFLKSGKFFIERSDKVDDINYPPLSVTKFGIVDQLKDVAKTNSGDNRKLVKKNDFVINSRSDRKGSSGISPRDGSVSLINIVLEPKNIHPQFIFYLFKSYYFKEEFFRNGKGIHWDLWTTRWDQFKNIYIPVPKEKEQILISQYLDKKTKQIDSLIEKIEKKIELLNEQKTALINQYITKGLDPNVEMKDSGIEWIGEIPKHWEVKTLKYIGKVTLGKMLTPNDKGGMILKPYLRSLNVQENNLNLDSINEMWFSSFELEQLSLKKGDILINEGGEVGRSCILENDLHDTGFQNAINRLRLFNDDPTFISWLIHLNFKKGYYSSIVNRVSIAHLTKEKLENSLVVTPSLIEQSEISKVCNDQEKSISKILNKEHQRIFLLKEYRQSLISSVVTGKIRITEDMI